MSALQESAGVEAEAKAETKAETDVESDVAAQWRRVFYLWLMRGKDSAPGGVRRDDARRVRTDA